MKNPYSIHITLLVLVCVLVGCSDGGNNDSGSSAAVSQTASRQGTAAGVVDYDGDGIQDLFVGAPYATAEAQVGAVLIYQGDAASFSATPTWTLTGGDNFGSGFTNVGDIDGDGTNDFAISASNGDGPQASLSGSVTVYQGGSGGQILHTLGGEQALDKFGYSVTGNCDLNADGHTDLVIGAISHSPGPDRYLGGAVYVYFGPELAETERVKIGATAHTGILGFASACGDVNNDSVDDLVVSAIWTHGVIWHDSKVLVYYGHGGFDPQTDVADVTIASTSTHFGDALAVLDDLDGDGFNEIAIGHPYFYAIPRPFDFHKGSVHVVRGGQGARAIDIAAPGPDLLTRIYGGSHLERFGSAIAPVGDLDGDGKPEFAVGAPHGNADGATDLATGLVSGKVYLFYGKDVQTDGTATEASVAIGFSRPERDLHYGACLALLEQNGPKLLIGAPTADRQTGAVYVQDL